MSNSIRESSDALVADAFRSTLHIAQMDCPTEEALIRGRLTGMGGVAALEFNLIQRTLLVTHATDALPGVIEAIRELGMDARPMTAETAPSPAAKNTRQHWLLALSGIAATTAELVHWFDGGNHFFEATLAIAMNRPGISRQWCRPSPEQDFNPRGRSHMRKELTEFTC
jgi:cation transport ATPase